jgi:hypothetical protein
MGSFTLESHGPSNVVHLVRREAKVLSSRLEKVDLSKWSRTAQPVCKKLLVKGRDIKLRPVEVNHTISIR